MSCNDDPENNVLSPGDYDMPHQGTVWITVNNLSVAVQRTEEGVILGAYPAGRETDTGLFESVYVLFTDVKPDPDSPEWKAKAGQLAIAYSPGVRPCQQCGEPVVRSRCCTFCGSTEP